MANRLSWSMLTVGTLKTLSALKKTESKRRMGFRQLQRAMSYLHGVDRAHCDMKEGSALASIDGVVKVADLGLTCHSDGVEPGESFLPSLLRAPAYNSPECLIRFNNGKPVAISGTRYLLVAFQW